MKQYYTKITPEEMIRAKKDNDALMGIMARLEPYINYISNIMYRKYGGEYDNATSREDLHSFCSMNIMRGIKNYYHPNRYNKKKDKKGNEFFKDGFSYVCQISKNLLKYWWRYHRRQKRIPPEMVVSLDSPIDPHEENSLTVGDLIVNLNKDMKNSFIAEKILKYFSRRSKKIGKVKVYSIAKHIIEDNMGYRELAKKYDIPEEKMKKIIKEEIVDTLKLIKL